MSVTGSSYRQWRKLGALTVAVAMLFAVATSQAAASSDPSPSIAAAELMLDEGVMPGCEWLMEAPVDGASCQSTATKDLSGKRVEVRRSDADPRVGEAAKSPFPPMITITITVECHQMLSLPVWLCNYLVQISTYYPCVFCRAGQEQAPTDLGKDEIVAIP